MTEPDRESKVDWRPMMNMFTPQVTNVIKPSLRATERHDPLTVGAVAVIVYALASVLHEGAGHGGACLLVAGVPRELSSMHFNCDVPAESTAARIVSAGGTIATIIGGLLGLALYMWRKGPPLVRYGFWLFAAVNLLRGTGHFMFTGISNLGDWATVIRGTELVWLWRSVFVIAGFALYWWITVRLFALVDPLIGEARPRRYEHAMRLGVRAYLVGAAFQILSGLFNPGGFELVLLSGAAASLGGTSGLLWGAATQRGTRTPSSKLEKAVDIVRRSWITIVLALLTGIAFVVILGPGLELSEP